ncbi:carboxymuconolactone decarboxylase family protein [Cryptosporangium sp. NPDC048952]|uniref:carboxymuconolactone decarboxylase family protein n=1 Tax=Cryptosporangium sp. NPDC048952 TaxID=3363961 RepID=UPI0037109C9B
MRVDAVDPADLSAAQQPLYDLYTTGRRVAPGSPFTLVDADGRLQGPAAIWITHPTFGTALQQLGSTVRWESALPVRAREIAILLVGHHHESAFELYAHRLAGAAAGLTPDDLTALSEGTEPAEATEVESCVFRTTASMLRNRTLTDDEFRDATTVLGAPGLLELTTIVGYYNLVALQLAVFDVQPPA